MTKQSFFFMLTCCLFSTAYAQQGSFHLITCIDNINEDIREGCQKDYSKAAMVFKAVAEDAGMAFKEVRSSFSGPELKQHLSNLQCGSDDVVVFLYSGHGFKFEDDGEEYRWPLMFLCPKERKSEMDPDCEFDLDEAQMYIQSAGPRLSITLGDCCNNDIDGLELGSSGFSDGEEEEGEQHSNLGLFTNFSGHIIASAASPGEAGNTSDEEGSAFTNALLKSIYNALQPNAPATSWERIFSQTRSAVQQSTPNQTPQFWISQ